MKKSSLREAILAHLRRELAQQIGAAQMARDEAISEESRAENKYDTHSQETAYLAEGQARIANEIDASIAHYAALPLPDFAPDAPIALGALVELENRDGKTHWYFLGPRAGGIEVQLEGQTVLVVTPPSPLGGVLLGKRAGETVPLSGRGAKQAQRIRSVA
ncbi:MAG: transcription elongation factor [Opitutaceae bacterium]